MPDNLARQIEPSTPDSGVLAVSRAISELREGREVSISKPGDMVTVAALETLNAADLLSFGNAQGELSLLLSPERAEKLGFDLTGEAVIVDLPLTTPLAELACLAGLQPQPWPENRIVNARPVTGFWVKPALELARQGRMAPALICQISLGRLSEADRLSVTAGHALIYPQARGRKLERVSSANVPLAAHDQCEFIAWRERFGDLEHLAIVVGHPDFQQSVLVRLHSSCLTGDLFASLRCDCGEQLQGAIVRMAKNGGGVLLYLAQEGRGIGLANKLRAYQLQDEAYDTLEADRYLGFRADERDYTVAGTMLNELGISRVKLLTNNPIKLAALEHCGITVEERVPINIPPNPLNSRYMQTKHERAGHLGPELAEPKSPPDGT